MSARLKRTIFWVAISIPLLAALVIAFWPRAVPVDIARITRGELVVTVDEEGETRVRDVYVLSAPVAGRMQRIDADVGDEVIATETVIVEIEPIDPTFLDSRSQAQAQADVHAAESAEAFARAELQQADAELEFARSELDRARRLILENTISQRDLDEAERAYKTARAARDTARAGLQVRAFELERARAQLLSPTQPRAARGECECIPITAPVSGRILRIMQESEGVIAAGEKLVEIGDPTDLEIVVDLLSSDAVSVDAGMRVLIEDWGGAAPLEGRVRRVEPFGFTKVSALGIEEQRVNVVIDFVSPPQEWRRLAHGYQVEAGIVLWESDDVLTLPVTALFRSGESWAVFVVRDGRAELQPVAIGRRNGSSAEIVEGLSEGDAVILHPGNRVSDAVRVVGRS